MNQFMYVVFDAGVNAYQTPFFSPSAREAMYAFTEARRNPESDFYKWANDYTLFRLGHFNQHSAEFHLEDSPIKVLCAWEIPLEDETSSFKSVEQFRKELNGEEESPTASVAGEGSNAPN